MANVEPQNTDELIELLKKTIKENKESEMNAVIGRIPLLCQSVLNIHEILQEIKLGQTQLKENLDKRFVTKESFVLVKTIVYTMCGLILVAVVVTLLHSIGLTTQ